MKRTLLRTALTTDQEGKTIKLDYYLLSEYAAGLEQYGAEIRMLRERKSERCAIKRITPLAGSMRRIIQALAEGSITPTTMRDVLEDIL